MNPVYIFAAVLLVCGQTFSAKNDYCAPGCKRRIGELDERITALEERNEWKLMFRAPKGGLVDVLAKWKSANPSNNDDAEKAADFTKAYYNVFKSEMVEQWGSMMVDEVKVALFNDGEEKANFIFNGRGTSKLNFMSKVNLMASTEQNTLSRTSFNYFSVDGHTAWNRNFFISASYGGCGNDQAFLVVVDQGTGACPWMEKEAKPYFMYCPNDGPCNMESEALIADTFAIFVKTRM